ncbi:DUF935 family protein [Geobacter pelophilus]|uniref:DUF935 family protein n=1 Tax=Geoanaerobacter pelophilus TaxID=60036 RepID=A0AAW4L220_9BACT|nr:DUF935 domain-containing protein [Geoanaerobacter pelophilus]MBT0664769.1 DUF935 family protein [Geoanaerobacter pelophilus]
MANITLYDAYDRPVQRQQLGKEQAAPAMTGIRSLWNHSSVTSGLTPQRLARLLRNADEGEADDYLTLAEEMEEKDPHYASVLGTRKRAVARLPIVVEAASDDDQDVRDADAVRLLMKRAGIKGMIEDLLDALGKGHSVVENIWNTSETPWVPGRLEWRDPRFFQYDRVTLRELRLKDDSAPMDGLPLTPFAFIVHIPRLKSGIPIRGGLARLAAWTFMFKNYTVKDWVAFCEVYGMPLRVGKYRPGETEDNISILRSAVANLGSDAAAVFPEGMLIELIERTGGTGGESLFERAADWFDKQLSKAVLGQTMTADDGSSQSQATVHNEVREDIRDADAEQLAETIERDLIKPFLDLNFGPRKNYPHLCFREPETTDIPVMAKALALLVPLGLRVEVSEVRDRLGFSDPAKDAECLAPAKSTEPVTIKENKLPPETALNAERIAEARDASDQLTDLLAQRAMAQNDIWIGLLQGLVNSSADLEDLRDRIIELFGHMRPDEFGGLMAQAMTLAEAAGRADVMDGD